MYRICERNSCNERGLWDKRGISATTIACCSPACRRSRVLSARLPLLPLPPSSPSSKTTATATGSRRRARTSPPRPPPPVPPSSAPPSDLDGDLTMGGGGRAPGSPLAPPPPFPTTADGDGFEEDAHLRCGDRCRRQISAASALVSRTATPAFSLQTAVQWGDREKRHVRMTCGSHVGPTIFCYFVCETGIWVPRANSQIFVTHNRHNMSCDPCTNSNICVPMLLYSKQDTKFVI